MLGSGAYGQVCRATLDELPCVAKILNAFWLDPDSSLNRISFQLESRVLSEIRHPNIVQCLGIVRDEKLGMSLLMELMNDCLTHFLEQSEEPLAYHVQVNISHDITLAVAFLHMNGIIHRDLSSNNVLVIGPGSRAKVTDFWMSTLTEENVYVTGVTMCLGNPAYMSPEALLDPPVYTEKLDCFQVGVLMLQIMTRKYPVPGRAMNQVQDTKSLLSWKIDPEPELQRRHNHLSLVAETHPMLGITKDCLKDTNTERPSAQQICRCLSPLKETPQYVHSLEGKRGEREGGESVGEGHEMEGEAQERKELIQQRRKDNQEMEEVWDEGKVREERKVEHIRIETQMKETENETLKSVVGEDRKVREKEREVETLQNEIQVKESEKETLRRMVAEKEGEVREKEREVENLRDEAHVRERDIETLRRVLQEREKDARVKNEDIEHLYQLIQDKDQTIHQLQETQQFTSSYTCLVSGPGLQSATANHPTHVMVELSDSSERPYSMKQNVTAELILLSTSLKSTPTSNNQRRRSKKTPSSISPISSLDAVVAVKSPSRYEVSYTAVKRGSHKLHVRVNGSEINSSPFVVTVYPDPTQLGSSLRIVKDISGPYDIAFNSHGEMIVSECDGNKVSVFDVRGQKVRSFGSHGFKPVQMVFPAGIAVDETNNIYVSSQHKLQKFTSSGELIKCIGRKGSKEAEFTDPRGVTIHSNKIYVCDTDNHRIQVFDMDLNYIHSIGSCGRRRGKFVHPVDAAFSTAGNMYVVEYMNSRVQVLDSRGHCVKMFGDVGKGKLSTPTALHIADKYVYVSDMGNHQISVYEISGRYVTSFGRRGARKEEFKGPYCITSCVNGCIYVCDYGNTRIQVF